MAEDEDKNKAPEKPSLLNNSNNPSNNNDVQVYSSLITTYPELKTLARTLAGVKQLSVDQMVGARIPVGDAQAIRIQFNPEPSNSGSGNNTDDHTINEKGDIIPEDSEVQYLSRVKYINQQNTFELQATSTGTELKVCSNGPKASPMKAGVKGDRTGLVKNVIRNNIHLLTVITTIVPSNS
eukprot:TRINITY_DN636_c2_g3_i1.p1 TRINITY_DN636_c2_g3~~TRINITY_DN636_c2_g3_i1.p1  ORF type:complete len:181 (-),score=35.03 TRINITY_DN636_c2_g3_i1:671-1213(-)